MGEENLTAAETILLAAHDLNRSGQEPFTEWDLTVAAWERDRARFGCRGYEDRFPDHKRVMMEIMSRKKKDNPLRRGFIKKVRPNYYSLTPLGEAAAEQLSVSAMGAEGSDRPRSPGPIFVAVERFASHNSFKRWQEDPEEPRSWLGAAAFLGIARNTPTELQDRLREVRTAVRQALVWCEENNTEEITRGSHGGGRVMRSDLEELEEFVSVLEDRFHRQMDAIMRKDIS